MLSRLQARSQFCMQRVQHGQVKSGRRVLLSTTPSEPSHMRTLCKAQNQRKPGLPSTSIIFHQILSVRDATGEVNKELVQFSRYDPWHATVYFGICSSISVKNSIRVGPIGLTRSLSLERFRAFWHTFLNRSRTWCEASRRSWMVWSQHSGRCLERLEEMVGKREMGSEWPDSMHLVRLEYMKLEEV